MRWESALLLDVDRFWWLFTTTFAMSVTTASTLSQLCKWKSIIQVNIYNIAYVAIETGILLLVIITGSFPGKKIINTHDSVLNFRAQINNHGSSNKIILVIIYIGDLRLFNRQVCYFIDNRCRKRRPVYLYSITKFIFWCRCWIWRQEIGGNFNRTIYGLKMIEIFFGIRYRCGFYWLFHFAIIPL